MAMPPIFIITTSMQLENGTAQVMVIKLPAVISTLFPLQSGGHEMTELSTILQ
jgi:hypothetical protein